MILDLDDRSSRDPLRVGGKAAALARARATGAPVLPGFVVESAPSLAHMALGARALARRGSGGARLAVSAEPISFAETLIAAGEELGHRLVARSSTVLEGSGEWSGAFASYVDVAPIDLPKAVAGCWASAFSVSALQRQEMAGIEAGSFPMAVLIQPSLTPKAGGWAKIATDGTVVIQGVKGLPAPLLQGWVSGSEAWFEGTWQGDELADLVGLANLDAIRDLLVSYAPMIGADACEWALTDRVWALQFSKAPTPAAAPQVGAPKASPEMREMVELVEAMVLAPGRLGEQAVLPWAIAGLPDAGPSNERCGADTVAEIRHLSREITTQVWEMPAESAFQSAHELLDRLSAGATPETLQTINRLNRPDPPVAARLLGKIRSVRRELVDRGVLPHERVAWQLDLESIEAALQGDPVATPGRAGVGRWEPLVSSVVLTAGRISTGVPASPGIGAGLRAHNDTSPRVSNAIRGVITAPRPVPALAPLLWDASAVVTATGSPAAHLFDAARSLRVPAVCGLDFGEPGREIIAVDGNTGTVATLPVEREI